MALKSLTPILNAKDLEASVAYYQQKLGFTLEWAMRGPDGRMVHVSVAKDDVRLMLGVHPDGVTGAPGATLYIDIDDVDAYYSTVRAAGATILEEPKDQFWGDRTFMVVDLDGYVFMVGQTVKEIDPSTLSMPTEPVPA